MFGSPHLNRRERIRLALTRHAEFFTVIGIYLLEYDGWAVVVGGELGATVENNLIFRVKILWGSGRQ